MTLRLRFMHPADVAQVVDIDARSFPDPWPMRSYLFEINESRISHMCSLVDQSGQREPPTTTWLERLLRRTASPSEQVLAYGGLWCIAEEAHISTIAVNPSSRGRGYGEVVLAGMLLRSVALNAGYVVLEVRVSNRVGHNLYAKYGFAVTEVNRKYYRDGEDAFVMRLELANSATVAQVQHLYEQVRQRVAFEDAYSRAGHPRLEN